MLNPVSSGVSLTNQSSSLRNQKPLREIKEVKDNSRDVETREKGRENLNWNGVDKQSERNVAGSPVIRHIKIESEEILADDTHKEIFQEWQRGRRDEFRTDPIAKAASIDDDHRANKPASRLQKSRKIPSLENFSVTSPSNDDNKDYQE